jgi:hypothetical protein
MIIKIIHIKMGSGSSSYDRRIEKQESFVRQNLSTFKSKLNEGKNNRNSWEMTYSDDQVAGKLRQLYHKTDTFGDNKNSYINRYEWDRVKKSIVY